MPNSKFVTKGLWRRAAAASALVGVGPLWAVGSGCAGSSEVGPAGHGEVDDIKAEVGVSADGLTAFRRPPLGTIKATLPFESALLGRPDPIPGDGACGFLYAEANLEGQTLLLPENAMVDDMGEWSGAYRPRSATVFSGCALVLYAGKNQASPQSAVYGPSTAAADNHRSVNLDLDGASPASLSCNCGSSVDHNADVLILHSATRPGPESVSNVTAMAGPVGFNPSADLIVSPSILSFAPGLIFTVFPALDPIPEGRPATGTSRTTLGPLEGGVQVHRPQRRTEPCAPINTCWIGHDCQPARIPFINSLNGCRNNPQGLSFCRPSVIGAAGENVCINIEQKENIQPPHRQ